MSKLPSPGSFELGAVHVFGIRFFDSGCDNVLFVPSVVMGHHLTRRVWRRRRAEDTADLQVSLSLWQRGPGKHTSEPRVQLGARSTKSPSDHTYFHAQHPRLPANLQPRP